MDLDDIRDRLVSEIGLSKLQADVFLFVTVRGKKTARHVSAQFGIREDEALGALKSLVALGSLIDLSETEFEAMHPRFTSVNMYRRMCERRGVKFGRNKTIDSIGAVLEGPYDDARTK